MATDRNPAVAIAAASGDAEPARIQRNGGKGCLVAGWVGVILLLVLVLVPRGPSLIRMRIKGDQVLAINNGK
jgi:hypothetical protein